MKVEVFSVKDAGYYTSEYASGSTVKVTLKRGEDFATCDSILIWEEDMAEDYFDEWLDCAVALLHARKAVVLHSLLRKANTKA